MSRTVTVQNTTEHYLTDLTLTFDVWPDQGGLTLAPKLRYTGSPPAVTALVVAGGLLWWVRRTSYDED